MKRRKDKKDYWVFPGGGVESGEQPMEAVKREIKEETSLEVTNVLSHHTYPDSENPDCKHFFIVCEVEEGYPTLGGPEKEKNHPEDDHIPMWVNIKDALKFEELYPVAIKNHLRDMEHETHRS